MRFLNDFYYFLQIIVKNHQYLINNNTNNFVVDLVSQNL